MAVERAPDIEQMVRDARAAWKAGDLQALEPMLSHEASLLFMGSDPGEVWRGRDQVLRAAQAQRLGGDAGVESVVDEVVAYRDGEVGWSIELGRFLLGGHGAELPTRGVSVFRREQGRWRYLQSVVSVAVPDAALEPGSPLRSSHMASRQPDGS